jgi:hypothetical protein
MNVPSERNPDSDSGGGTIVPPILPIDAGTLIPTAGSDRSAALAPSGDSLHTVSAIYPSRAEAEGVRQHLIELGFTDSALRIIDDPSQSLMWTGPGETDRDEVLRDLLVDGAIGTAVGTGIGAIGAVALAAASVTLFVASPVVAPLAMLGWFAGLGGVVGAAVGANRKDGGDAREGKFSELVMDAVEKGNTALVVRTHNEAERELAKRIITDSLQGTDQLPAQS